jgi:hypothetical protein
MKIKASLKDYTVLLLLFLADHKKEAGLLLCTFIMNILFTFAIFSEMEKYRPIPQKNIFSQEIKLQEARKAYARYRTMDKRELQYAFFQITGEWTYKLAGPNQYKMGDCVGAVDATLEHFGSFLPREDVGQRINRLERLRLKGATFKCISNGGVMAPKTGDLIFIQTGYNNPSHEAIVYDVQNGYVRYLEMGGVTLSANLMSMPINDSRIHSIYSMTIETWLGE